MQHGDVETLVRARLDAHRLCKPFLRFFPAFGVLQQDAQIVVGPEVVRREFDSAPESGFGFLELAPVQQDNSKAVDRRAEVGPDFDGAGKRSAGLVHPGQLLQDESKTVVGRSRVVLQRDRAPVGCLGLRQLARIVQGVTQVQLRLD